jgi:ATP-dependent exoDNAse (exonuclease V) alpha subunit
MISLNEKQAKAQTALTKYLNGPLSSYLLLGMAGSGKTTVIVNTFNQTKLYVAFCAFTNKATQVLCKISKKFNISFSAQFMTIHQILALELKFSTSEIDINFNFNLNKAVASMASFDVVILDECSTISTELYGYLVKTQNAILQTTGKLVKFVFVGDYWQLPPVNEKSAIVFDTAIKSKWPVSKLEVIMRSNNDEIRSINNTMLEWIPRFKSKDTDDFINNYPYNLVPRESNAYINVRNIPHHYIDTWHNKTPDCVILTCSRKNCTKINLDIQHILYGMRSIEPPVTDHSVYMAGDRICIVRPITLFGIKQEGEITELSSQLPITLYNGEIFDVLQMTPIKVKTELNKFDFISQYFNAYKLKIRKINTSVDDTEYEIIYIPDNYVDEARAKLKSKLFSRKFIEVMNEFVRKYPKLDYGYCLTVYKSQGSEWNTVYVNLNNIQWCITGGETDVSTCKKIQLYKNTYTAVSRAANEVYCAN